MRALFKDPWTSSGLIVIGVFVFFIFYGMMRRETENAGVVARPIECFCP